MILEQRAREPATEGDKAARRAARITQNVTPLRGRPF